MAVNFLAKINDMFSSKSNWAQKLLMIVVIYFVSSSIINQVSLIKLSDLNISIRFVLLALLFELGARLFVGIGYYQLLKYFGVSLSFVISIAISWVSFLGKYLPGKIAVIASAIYFLKQYKVPTATAGMVPILNTMITIFVALVLSIPLLISGDNQGGVSVLYFTPFLILGISFFFRPRWFFVISNIIFKRLGISEIKSTFTSSQIGLCIFIICIQCVLAGMSTWLICRSILFTMDISLLPRIVSITAFSGTMGLLAFFSPAGIGVRDGFFYICLSPITGLENAAVIVIILRLVHTITDLGSAAMGFVFLKTNKILHIRKSND